MSDEGRQYADEINKELASIYEGEKWVDADGNEEYGQYGEMIEKFGNDFEEDYEQVSFGDWIADSVYDMRFVVERDKSFRSVMLMLAGGGPTIWLNTENSMIEFSWGGDPTEYYPVAYGVCEEIDDFVRDAIF